MKILEENLKQGEILLKIESLNDLWTLYNVITPGDSVSARTSRRVVLKEGSKGERKPMRLKLKVEDVAFHEFSNRLRIKGTILEGPEDFVSYGSYHTFNMEPGQKLYLTKDSWMKNELKRLREKSKFNKNFLLLIVAMETGLSNIALVTNFSHNKVATIKNHIPGKRYEQSHRNKALYDFFESNKKILEEKIKENDISMIIISGPGNTREVFVNYLKEKSVNIDLSRVRSVHASSGTESAILETLKSQELQKIKENVKVIQESEKIEEILRILSTETDLIAIGPREVSHAAEHGAVEELFIADILIRGSSKEKKLEIEDIITKVENSGGKINILSTKHPTGKQIEDLGSLLAILRYKLY